MSSPVSTFPRHTLLSRRSSPPYFSLCPAVICLQHSTFDPSLSASLSITMARCATSRRPRRLRRALSATPARPRQCRTLPSILPHLSPVKFTHRLLASCRNTIAHQDRRWTVLDRSRYISGCRLLYAALMVGLGASSWVLAMPRRFKEQRQRQDRPGRRRWWLLGDGRRG